MALPKVALEQYLQKDYDFALMAEIIRQVEDAINRQYEGRIYQRFTGTAAPTSTQMSWQVGDEVLNSAPTELGSASSKYIIRGWVCIAAGNPGTWREMRVLTGN
jgi:hypothetical protein